MNMLKYRTKVYINANLDKNEIIFSGIEFREVIQYLHPPLNNLLLMKGDYIGDDCKHNFEMIEGAESIKQLAKDNIYGYGDFCFVDFNQVSDVENLTDLDISELLFLSHMYRPIKTAFFERLNNRFAYLAHDDGWYCKIYCNNFKEFLPIYMGKITNFIKRKVRKKICDIDENLQRLLFAFAENGVLIDLDDTELDEGLYIIHLYVVGKYIDMNEVLNNLNALKANASQHIKLCYKESIWTVDSVSL